MANIVLELNEGAGMFLIDVLENKENEIKSLKNKMEAAGLCTYTQEHQIELLWSVRGVLCKQLFE